MTLHPIQAAKSVLQQPLLIGFLTLCLLLAVALSIEKPVREVPSPVRQLEAPAEPAHVARREHLSAVDPYAGDSVLAQIYRDPHDRGVPLIMIEGLETERLSAHFQIKDFITRDDAPFARISLRLVRTLERIRWLADSPIYITSAYRHPAYNARRSVGGSSYSYHMAGLAVDIWSEAQTPGELAGLALDVTECAIGIGLGVDFVHIDLRGYLASWAQEDAALSEDAFDAWVEAHCGALRTTRAVARPSFAEAVEVSERQRIAEKKASDDSLLATYHPILAAYAAMQPQTAKGAVLLNFQQTPAMEAAHIPYKLSFVEIDTPEADELNLDTLLITVARAETFVYVIILPDGRQLMGAMGQRTPPHVSR